MLVKFTDRLQEAVERNAELASSPSCATSSTSIYYDVQNGDKRPANLVRRFGELYSLARLETLDALDALNDLVDAEELKNKLLFSVVVVRFSFFLLLTNDHDRFMKVQIIMNLKLK